MAMFSLRRKGSFEEFVERDGKLAWEGLFTAYYSDVVWVSKEAKEISVPPDRRSVSSIVG